MSYAHRGEGLGSWWQFWKNWYAVGINGTKWLAPRYLDQQEAWEWFLDQKEAQWNSTVSLFRIDGKSWRKVAG